MKKSVIVGIVLVLLLVFAGCNREKTAGSSQSNAASPAGGGALSGTLTVWSSGDELARFVPGFNTVYPDITVNITVVPNSDFIAKLAPAISGGQGVPDLFTGESDYVKYLVNSGFWDDLRNEPYNVSRYTDGIWEYVVKVGTDQSGAIRALSWQASPGSIMYRRDLAAKYLGSGEPAEVSAFLSGNEKLLETAAVLRKNGIKMFASWQDILNLQFSNRQQPWIVDDTLILEPSMLDFMDLAKTIVSNGYDLNVAPWAPEWTAAVESDDTFCYVLPTWGYQFVVKPSADKTKGNWGLAEGPVPYVKGGTWLGIYKNSPRKDLAWAFLEYVTCNTEAQRAYAAEYGEYVALKAADEALAQGAGEEVLGGQNLYQFYNEQMKKIPNDLMTPFDGQINNAFLSATNAYAAGALTKDRAIQQFKDDVLSAYPELAVQ
ncbi:MAG: extracellular solute-binding protein [Treponema sp.]|jgi:ABC-type glycerol-3-phosphate transport system substrate-binding protein|nr:extracellular solute-binding protein [Treponema sp.]